MPAIIEKHPHGGFTVRHGKTVVGHYMFKKQATDEAREYNQRFRTTTRKNPAGDITRVWICPNGQVLKIPRGRDWEDSVPNLLVARAYGHEVNHFYRGAIINERLYVYSARKSVLNSVLKKLEAYARESGLTRGVIIEKA